MEKQNIRINLRAYDNKILDISTQEIVNTAKRTGSNLSIIVHGRKINEQMPIHVVKITLDAFNERKINIENSTILMIRVSYTPNVKDIQLTPAQEIIEKLQEQGVSVHIYDPYFVSKEIFGIQTESNVDDVIQDLDACILVTAHDEFKKLPISLFNKMKHPILVDTRGVFDPAQVESTKLIFRGVGRGK